MLDKKLKEMLKWIMDFNPIKKVILYSDIVGSTFIAMEAKKFLGGLPNVGYIAYHHLIVANAVTSYNGEIKNKSGDGVLSTFDNAEDAISAAFLLNENFKRYNSWLQENIMLAKEVIIRIGMHKGVYFALPINWERDLMKGRKPELKENILQEELIGADICLAQRIQSVAPKGEIYFSEEFLKEYINKEVSQITLPLPINDYIIEEHQECVDELKEKGITNPPRIFSIELIGTRIVRKIEEYHSLRKPYIHKLREICSLIKKDLNVSISIKQLKEITGMS